MGVLRRVEGGAGRAQLVGRVCWVDDRVGGWGGSRVSHALHSRAAFRVTGSAQDETLTGEEGVGEGEGRGEGEVYVARCLGACGAPVANAQTPPPHSHPALPGRRTKPHHVRPRSRLLLRFGRQELANASRLPWEDIRARDFWGKDSVKKFDFISSMRVKLKSPTCCCCHSASRAAWAVVLVRHLSAKTMSHIQATNRKKRSCIAPLLDEAERRCNAWPSQLALATASASVGSLEMVPAISLQGLRYLATTPYTISFLRPLHLIVASAIHNIQTPTLGTYRIPLLFSTHPDTDLLIVCVAEPTPDTKYRHVRAIDTRHKGEEEDVCGMTTNDTHLMVYYMTWQGLIFEKQRRTATEGTESVREGELGRTVQSVNVTQNG
ncbi:Protein of unknown function [Gryllus bimaculatus]|nr:Protein of unknown function [Gryllus bimaculatus]